MPGLGMQMARDTDVSIQGDDEGNKQGSMMCELHSEHPA